MPITIAMVARMTATSTYLIIGRVRTFQNLDDEYVFIIACNSLLERAVDVSCSPIELCQEFRVRMVEAPYSLT